MNTLIIAVFIIAFIVFIFAKRGNMKGLNNITADQAQEFIKTPGITILDVRSPEEFRSGHIQGAKLIPVSELSGRLDELGDAKDKPLLVYCHSGSRSLSASQILLKSSFTNVTNLQGGISAWIGRGFSVAQ